MLYSTHDIDWLWPGHPIGVVKWLIGKKWVPLSRLLEKDLFLKQTEHLLAYQQSQNITGIYLVGMQGNGRSLFPKAIRYTYGDGLLKELIALLKQYKAEIGLHHHPKEPITQQANRFIKLTNQPPKYVRGHYYAPLSSNDSAWLAQNGCLIDFGYGNRHRIGFMDTEKNTTNLLQVHTIFSDNNLVSKIRNQAAFDAFSDVLELCQANQLDAAILFHPENMVIYPHLIENYAFTISKIKQIKLHIFND